MYPGWHCYPLPGGSYVSWHIKESGFRLKILQQMAVRGGNRVKTYKTTDGTKVKEKKKS